MPIGVLSSYVTMKQLKKNKKTTNIQIYTFYNNW